VDVGHGRLQKHNRDMECFHIKGNLYLHIGFLIYIIKERSLQDILCIKVVVKIPV
jgi:hypothetical protein